MHAAANWRRERSSEGDKVVVSYKTKAIDKNREIAAPSNGTGLTILQMAIELCQCFAMNPHLLW